MHESATSSICCTMKRCFVNNYLCVLNRRWRYNIMSYICSLKPLKITSSTRFSRPICQNCERYGSKLPQKSEKQYNLIVRPIPCTQITRNNYLCAGCQVGVDVVQMYLEAIKDNISCDIFEDKPEKLRLCGGKIHNFAVYRHSKHIA